MRKIISLIPARDGSTRLPGKNIANFHGKPLIAYTIEKCLPFSDEVYVSSDDQYILDTSEKYGSKIIKRPKEIAGVNSTPKEYIEHFFNLINPDINDIIVLCQPTSPLVNKEYYQQGIEEFKTGCYDTVVSVFEDKRRCYNLDGELLLENEKRLEENGAFYIFSRDTLDREYGIDGVIGFVEVSKLLSIDIDTKDDFIMAELIYGLWKNDKR